MLLLLVYTSTASPDIYLIGPPSCQSEFSSFALEHAQFVSVLDPCSSTLPHSPSATHVLRVPSSSIACTYERIGYVASQMGYAAVLVVSDVWSSGLGGVSRFLFFSCDSPIPLLFTSSNTPTPDSISLSPNWYDSYSHLILCVGPRLIITVALNTFKMCICVTLWRTLLGSNSPVPLLVVFLESLSCFLIYSMLGDTGFYTASLSLPVYLGLSNLAVLLPNLTTLLISYVYMYVLQDTGIYTEQCSRYAMLFTTVILIAVHIVVGLGSSNVIYVSSRVHGLNLLLIIVFNAFSTVLFIKYKSTVSRLSYSAGARDNVRSVRNSSLLYICCVLLLCIILSLCFVALSVASGNYNLLSWAAWVTYLFYTVLGIVHLLSLAISSQHASLSNLITRLIIITDKTAANTLYPNNNIKV